MWRLWANFGRIIFVFEPQELYFADVTQGFLTIPRADIIPGRNRKIVNHITDISKKIALPTASGRHTRGPPPATRSNPNFFAQEVL